MAKNINQQKTSRAKNMGDICSLLRSGGQEALASYKSNAPAAPVRTPVASFQDKLPRLGSNGADGQGHVNVSSQANTQIGQVLSLADPMPYVDPYLGIKVHSLRSFVNFIKTGMVKTSLLRRETVPVASEAYKLGKNSNLLIAWGLWTKISQYEDLKKILVDLTVPLDWYINKGDRPFRNNEGCVYLFSLLEIQKALIKDHPVQLWKLLDAEDLDRVRNLSPDERNKATNDIIEALLVPVSQVIGAGDASRAAAAKPKRQAKPGPRERAERKQAQAADHAPAPQTSAELDAMVTARPDTVFEMKGRKAATAPKAAPTPDELNGLADLNAAHEKQLASVGMPPAGLLRQEQPLMQLVQEVAEKAGNDAAEAAVATSEA